MLERYPLHTFVIHLRECIKLSTNTGSDRVVNGFEWKVCVGVCEAVVGRVHFVVYRRI